MTADEFIKILIITALVACLGGLLGHGIEVLLSVTPSGAGKFVGAGGIGLLGFIRCLGFSVRFLTSTIFKTPHYPGWFCSE